MKAGIRTIDKVFLLLFTGIGLTIFLLYSTAGKSIPEARALMIAYLGNPLESPEVWLTNLDGSSPVQLTHTQGKVYDFSISPDGDNLAYSALNEDGGADIYLIDREGNAVETLVQCGKSHCEQFVWQRGGILAAYSQYIRGLDFDSQIHLIDGVTGEEQKFPGGAELNGAYPSFSPDGQYLAFFDTTDRAIHIINLASGENIRGLASEPEFGSWTRDSKELFFTHTIMNGLLPQSRLYRFNLDTRQVTPFLQDELAGYDASPIEWSPDGEWGVFGLTDSDIQSGQQIYTVRKDGEDLQATTSEPGTSNAAYHWSPSGEQIVFQRYRAGMVDAKPQIAMWDRRSGTTLILSENGAMPAWLP